MLALMSFYNQNNLSKGLIGHYIVLFSMHIFMKQHLLNTYYVNFGGAKIKKDMVILVSSTTYKEGGNVYRCNFSTNYTFWYYKCMYVHSK